MADLTVNARLLAEQPDTSTDTLLADASRALTVSDAQVRSSLTTLIAAVDGLESNTSGLATQATLASVLTAVDGVEAALATLGTETTSTSILAKLEAIRALVAGTLTVGGTVALDAPTLAALESITAAITGTVAVTGPLTDSELRATPLPVSGTVTITATDLDVRNLDDTTDAVRSVDAAEDTTVTWTTIDFATSGAHTIVTVGPTDRLRLRRFLPTTASVPDVAGPPILTLTLGGHSLRSQALVGRFDLLGDAGEDLVITSSKAGQVDGTVGYTLEAA